MKSPFNWVGNKYKYVDIINELVKNENYNNVIDCFMGTGNILLNINTNGKNFIGNDKNKLLPKLYQNIKNIDTYSLEDIENILNKWNRFGCKEDYYTFRKYWNYKYINDLFDKNFIYETVLLLKMCSNSMVRFNAKHEFNQGFRGLRKNKNEFFTESMKDLIINGLENLNIELNKNNFIFTIKDILDIDINEKDLLILDPPYILEDEMYNMDFSKNTTIFYLIY